MPGLFSPIDKWLSDATPPDSRSTSAAAPGPNSGRVGAAPESSGVGTTGRGANPDVSYRTGEAGQVRSGNVGTPGGSDVRSRADQNKNREKPKPVPCESREAQASKATPPPSENGAAPCDENSPEASPDAAPPASR